ncbi:hypothetical protein O3M35_013290 [Rhynocoris fuscipes]|uniref:Retrotransposon gag domain-containing protein n=1 Tax=Rhynocoris fuscipes TaxID=488301 RepID=A0AAW1CDT6_9HEMI
MALEERGLPIEGTKPDLELRLIECLREEGIDPNEFRYDAQEIHLERSDVPKDCPESTEERLATEVPEISSFNNLFSLLTIELSNLKQDLIQNQEEKLQHVKEDLKAEITEKAGKSELLINGLRDQMSTEIDLIKDNVTLLEEKMEKRTLALENSVSSIEMRMNEETEKREQLSKSIEKIQETIKKNPVTVVSNSGMTVDPKVIRESLPEFHGKLEEDPNKFISHSTSLLQRTNLPEEIYVNIVTQQLKSSASAWWHNLKGLDLEWEDFKKELLLRFDSDSVKASVNKKFLTETQPTGMRAGAFVVQKFQLYKRLHPEEDGKLALPYIIELLNDKIRPLVKVAKPDSFEALREVIRQLEEEHKMKGNSEENRKCFTYGKSNEVKGKGEHQEN